MPFASVDKKVDVTFSDIVGAMCCSGANLKKKRAVG